MSIGNTLDVVVVRPKAFHSGSDSASSAASTNGNAAGSTPAIAALTATSSTVATPLTGGRTQTTWSAGYGDAASSASIASSVAGSCGTPSLQCSSQRELVLRARIGGDLDPFARERHAVTPRSSSTFG